MVDHSFIRVSFNPPEQQNNPPQWCVILSVSPQLPLSKSSNARAACQWLAEPEFFTASSGPKTSSSKVLLRRWMAGSGLSWEHNAACHDSFWMMLFGTWYGLKRYVGKYIWQKDHIGNCVRFCLAMYLRFQLSTFKFNHKRSPISLFLGTLRLDTEWRQLVLFHLWTASVLQPSGDQSNCYHCWESQSHRTWDSQEDMAGYDKVNIDPENQI